MREETDYTEAIEAYKNDSNVIIEPWGRSIDHLRLTIIGKEGTPYAKGKFIFEIKFPENYPFAPPLERDTSSILEKCICRYLNVA